jgi:hypothetical protein
MTKFAQISLLISTVFFGSFCKTAYGQDSTNVARQNYSFRPQLVVNFVRIGNSERRLVRKGNDINYSFQEFSLSGYIPFYEKKYKIKRPEDLAPSLSLLFTGSLSSW